jgi:hypothetical protein
MGAEALGPLWTFSKISSNTDHLPRPGSSSSIEVEGGRSGRGRTTLWVHLTRRMSSKDGREASEGGHAAVGRPSSGKVHTVFYTGVTVGTRDLDWSVAT